MTATPNIVLPEFGSAGVPSGSDLTQAMRRLDAVVQLAVIAFSSSPPASPLLGDRYIVQAPGTGLFEGHDMHVAAFSQQGWVFFVPRGGWLAVIGSSSLYVFDGSVPAWSPLSGGGGGSGNFSFVGSSTVVGSAATDITVTGLDLDADGCYFGTYDLDNSAGSTTTPSLFFNADTTSSNYDVQQTAFSGTGTTNVRSNSAAISGLTSGQAVCAYFYLRKNFDGRPRTLITSTIADNTAIFTFIMSHGWRTAGTNVTSLTFHSSVSNAFSIGSAVRVWKITT